MQKVLIISLAFALFISMLTINCVDVKGYLFGEREEPKGHLPDPACFESIQSSGFNKGDGTNLDPYLICTRAQLESVKDGLDKHYILGDNINLNNRLYTEPIINGLFTGTFNGRMYKIQNLMMRSTRDAGLFGRLGMNSVIQNLGIEGINITSNEGNIGSLAVRAFSFSTIRNCYAIDNDPEPDLQQSTSTSGYATIGGLVGDQAINSSIIASHATVDIYNAMNGSAGGIVGDFRGSIIASYATGNINNSGDAGGLVARQADDSSVIIASYAKVNINGNSSNNRMGGLVGYQDGGDTTIIASYATGNISGGGGNDTIGGLVGLHRTGIIVSSYALGSVDGGTGTNNVGALVGYQFANATIASSYGFGGVMNADTTGPDGSPGVSSANNLTLMSAGSFWGGANSPWRFSSAPPVLRFITGAVLTDDGMTPRAVTSVAYECNSPPATAFLPAISITCGSTPIPGQ